MRLLHVSSSFPVRPGDSTAPFMEEMTAALARRGHEVRVVVPDVEDLATGRRSGIEVTSYRYAPQRLQTWGYGRSLSAKGDLRHATMLIAPLAILAMVAKTRTEIRRWKPDVLHLHWLLPQGVISNFAPSYLPIVISLHGADVRMANSSKPLTTVAARSLRRADHLVAASGEMFDLIADLEDGVRTRSSIIPHGANAALFRSSDRAAARRRLGVDADQPMVLGVGRLVAKKGFEHLIAALSLVDNSDTQVFVAGDGPLTEPLTAMASRSARKVKLLGPVDRATLADWYTAADVVAVPSISRPSRRRQRPGCADGSPRQRATGCVHADWDGSRRDRRRCQRLSGPGGRPGRTRTGN